MPQKRHSAEEIVAKLRQADVLLAQGQTGADVVSARSAPKKVRRFGNATVRAEPSMNAMDEASTQAVSIMPLCALALSPLAVCWSNSASMRPR